MLLPASAPCHAPTSSHAARRRGGVRLRRDAGGAGALRGHSSHAGRRCAAAKRWSTRGGCAGSPGTLARARGGHGGRMEVAVRGRGERGGCGHLRRGVVRSRGFPPHLSAEQSCRRALFSPAAGARPPACDSRRQGAALTCRRQAGRAGGQGARAPPSVLLRHCSLPHGSERFVARTYVLTHPAWRLRPSPRPLLAQGGRRPIAGAGTGDVRRHTPRAGAACVRPWCARGRPQGEAQGAAGSAYCTTWWWRTTHPPLAG